VTPATRRLRARLRHTPVPSAAELRTATLRAIDARSIMSDYDTLPPGVRFLLQQWPVDLDSATVLSALSILGQGTPPRVVLEHATWFEYGGNPPSRISALAA
jgi:hypothetical protein